MNKVFKIVEKRKLYYCISAGIILLSLLVSLIRGVEVAIEFKGGTMISYSFTGELDGNVVASAASQSVGQTVSSKEGENFSDGSKYVELSFVSNEGLTADRQHELTESLQASFPENQLELLSSNDVKPSIGTEFFQKCLVAVAFAALVLIIYIALRFKKISGWSAGVMAVVALLHDCAIVYATFIFFNIPINAYFMAVLMTILGYSINDTIVIYDRIRENKKLMGPKTPVEELVNTSISQSLKRSFNTTISTVIALATICVVALFTGVTSILSFAFPLIIGMISGTYSSICMAGPLWVDWQNKKKPAGYADKKKR
ncbi:MAG: protein translocase subunit SecF [Oscillospiraceae bacterium]